MAVPLVRTLNALAAVYNRTDGPMGKVMLTVLGMVAEMELGFIKERQLTGIAKAKAAGVYKGTPVKLDWQRIKSMKAEGTGATEIAKAMGCSRGMVYKALNAPAR
jgi:DNA invertase Pin-like site-specific DNA recombinase